MPNYVPDPIPIAPFLAWYDKRCDQIERDLNCVPAIKGPGGHRWPTHCGPTTRVALELGWTEADLRRFRRSRNGTPTTPAMNVVSRAWVEDSLWRAGVAFEDVYPSLDRERVCA